MSEPKRYRVTGQYFGMWHLGQVITEADFARAGIDVATLGRLMAEKKVEPYEPPPPEDAS